MQAYIIILYYIIIAAIACRDAVQQWDGDLMKFEFQFPLWSRGVAFAFGGRRKGSRHQRHDSRVKPGIKLAKTTWSHLKAAHNCRGECSEQVE